MGQERVFGSMVVSANNRLGTPSLGLAGRVLAAARGLAKGPGIHPGPCRHPRPLGSRRLEDISRRGDNRGFDDNRRAETWLAATVGNGTSQPPQWTAAQNCVEGISQHGCGSGCLGIEATGSPITTMLNYDPPRPRRNTVPGRGHPLRSSISFPIRFPPADRRVGSFSKPMRAMSIARNAKHADIDDAGRAA